MNLPCLTYCVCCSHFTDFAVMIPGAPRALCARRRAGGRASRRVVTRARWRGAGSLPSTTGGVGSTTVTVIAVAIFVALAITMGAFYVRRAKVGLAPALSVFHANCGPADRTGASA
jgi:hypothetical protein